MSIPFKCECGYITDVKDEFAGRGVKCPHCKRVSRVPDLGDAEPSRNPFIGAGTVVTPAAEKRKEYKVLTQKDTWFSGKFDPERLEAALNSYAAQGWTLKGMATASITGLLSADREEVIFVLER